MKSADGYWTVEVVRYGPKERWFRVLHGDTVVADRTAIGTVQHILGDAYATLQAVEAGKDDGVA
jgi:hypothetical protein